MKLCDINCSGPVVFRYTVYGTSLVAAAMRQRR